MEGVGASRAAIASSGLQNQNAAENMVQPCNKCCWNCSHCQQKNAPVVVGGGVVHGVPDLVAPRLDVGFVATAVQDNGVVFADRHLLRTKTLVTLWVLFSLLPDSTLGSLGAFCCASDGQQSLLNISALGEGGRAVGSCTASMQGKLAGGGTAFGLIEGPTFLARPSMDGSAFSNFMPTSSLMSCSTFNHRSIRPQPPE